MLCTAAYSTVPICAVCTAPRGAGRAAATPTAAIPQPLRLRSTRRIRTASPHRAPPVGLGLGDECEMRVARWGRVRAGRPSTEASERDGGGRRASRWRPGDPAMRLRRRVDMVTAGEQGAWRNRHRLPGGGCRLGLRRCEKELPPARSPVHPRKALRLAQTRRLQPSCELCVVTDLLCAPPVEGRRPPTFCLPGRRPTSGQPSARRARKVAEGAASGVGVTGARARPPRASLWLERGPAATAELRESRW